MIGNGVVVHLPGLWEEIRGMKVRRAARLRLVGCAGWLRFLACWLQWLSVCSWACLDLFLGGGSAGSLRECGCKQMRARQHPHPHPARLLAMRLPLPAGAGRQRGGAPAHL